MEISTLKSFGVYTPTLQAKETIQSKETIAENKIEDLSPYRKDIKSEANDIKNVNDLFGSLKKTQKAILQIETIIKGYENEPQ